MRLMFITASLAALAVIFGTNGNGTFTQKAKPSLSGATGWLNSQPLDLAKLRGKVVLIDFWTFTCINWRRTLPYINEWAAKYKDQGLVVIGVHTPEFSFEQKSENVNRSITEMKIDYPVAMDNQYHIWQSFNNHYWPAVYLIDRNGKVRFQKFGEGDYTEVERQIQHLLQEASATNVPDKLSDIQPQGFEAAADWDHLRSPENFLGYNRTEGFVSPERVAVNKPSLYSLPRQLNLNQWALSGEWIMGQEGVRLNKSGGKVVYRFHARDLHLIMGLETPGKSAKFRVLIDGNPPGDSHGLDIDSNGNGMVSEQRMYQLIRQRGRITEHEFIIEFFEPDVEVYDFTFG